ncbi:hypothetical protein OG21DRAFT_765940 [Imleria badia]|nr:hypothetical protein OG21DRAFT_765940 [Imleria badia]
MAMAPPITSDTFLFASLAYMASWPVPRLDAFISLWLSLVSPLGPSRQVWGSLNTTVSTPGTLFVSKCPVRWLDLFAWSHCLVPLRGHSRGPGTGG